jgi:hypothetical protein
MLGHNGSTNGSVRPPLPAVVGPPPRDAPPAGAPATPPLPPPDWPAIEEEPPLVAAPDSALPPQATMANNQHTDKLRFHPAMPGTS